MARFFGCPTASNPHPFLLALSRGLKAVSLTIVLPLVSLGTATAQTQTDPAAGVVPFSTRAGSAYDSVDPATSNVMVTIPVRSKIGKIPFSFNLIGNSHAYIDSDTVTVEGKTQTYYFWHFNGGPSGQVFAGDLGAYLANTTFAPGSGVTNCGSSDGYYSGFYVVDPTGASHLLPSTMKVDTAGCIATPVVGVTGDGSGFTVTITSGNPLTWTLSDPSGIVVNPAAGTATDRDGVYVSVSGDTYSDSLQQPVLTVTTSGYSYPNSNGVPVTVGYTAYYQKTAFDCTYTHNLQPYAVADYAGTTTTNFPTSVTMPDGEVYGISYETTPGYASGSGYITGRIAQLTLGSSGSISYTYAGGNSGVNCESEVVPTLTRTVNDGKGHLSTWTYVNNNTISPTECAPAGNCNFTVAVTDPAGNQTVYNFAGEYQTQVNSYEGGCPTANTGCNGGGTLLKTMTTCYNGNFSSCAAPTSVPLNYISQTDVYTSFNGGSSNLVQANYDAYGNTIEVKQYDFGAAMPPTGNPLSDTLTYYGQSWNSSSSSCSAYPSGTYIYNTPCYSYTKNSALATVAQTQITYSNTGHPTTITRLTSGSNSLTTTATYSTTNGTLATATDVNSALYAYGYNGTDGCNSLLPTSVIVTGTGLPSGGLTTSTQWNCSGGVVTQTSDANQPPNNYAYGYNDPLWRLKSTTDPMSNVTNYSYTTPTTFESVMNFNGTTSTSDQLATTDGLGRQVYAQTRQGQGSGSTPPFDTAQTAYGWISANTGACTTQPPFTTGACTTQSMPYTGAAGASAPTGTAVTTTKYDALGRPLTVTDGGGGVTSYQYVQNDVLQSVGPTQTFQKQLEYDGLGRLSSVCEISTTLPGVGTCGQTTTQTGYWTRYEYDALGDLTAVCQNTSVALSTDCVTSPSAGQQTRTYTYDGLSRLTSEKNPETGTTTYTYDTSSTCGTSTFKGDLIKKVDAVGDVICYAHDGLHRQTSITHPSGSYASVTADSYFVYDSATVDGVAMQNAAGHNAEAYTVANGAGAKGTKLTDEGFGYDADGRLAGVYQSTPNSGGYYATTAKYWANSTVNTLTGVPGLSGWTFVPDGEGRPFSATYGSGTSATDWVTGTTYYPSNPATTVTYGDSDTDTDIYSFDATTGRMNQFQFNVGSTPTTLTGKPGWNQNWTLGTLGITDGFTPANTQTCNYGFDALARIKSVGCVNSSGTTIWTQSFTPDPFGNISKSGTSSFAASYLIANGTTNNQEQSVGTCVPTYDANGNLTKDCTNSDAYAWNADGKPTTLAGKGITYDALGREVEIASGSTHTQILYSPIGKLGTMNGQSAVTIRVPLPGGSTAELLGATASTRHILHSDWLGSARLSTAYTDQTVANDTAYAPYGEAYAGSSTDLNFTGQSQDTVSGLYDFLYREYSPVQGRWISPDLSGVAAVDPTNPQSWNRYAYVLNNPISNTDPLGLYCAYLNDAGDGVAEIDDDGDENGCGNNGGYWIVGSYGGGSWVNINVNSGAVAGLGYDSGGNAEISIAGAMGSNAWGAWTQTFGTGGALNMLSPNYVPFSLLPSPQQLLQAAAQPPIAQIGKPHLSQLQAKASCWVGAQLDNNGFNSEGFHAPNPGSTLFPSDGPNIWSNTQAVLPSGSQSPEAVNPNGAESGEGAEGVAVFGYLSAVGQSYTDCMEFYNALVNSGSIGQ